MKHKNIFAIIGCLLLTATTCFGYESAEEDVNLPAEPNSLVIDEMYQFLATGPLSYAIAADLPEGTLLKSGDFTVSEEQLNDIIELNSEEIKPQLKKYSFYLLEQISVEGLLTEYARNELSKTRDDISQLDDPNVLNEYIGTLKNGIEVSEEEILEFYNAYKDSLVGMPLESVKLLIQNSVTQQKLQMLIDEKVLNLGKNMRIEISADWLKIQAETSRDNPIDKARMSGKISFIHIRSNTCSVCDEMKPAINKLTEKYKDKIDIIVIQTEDEPVLSLRYGAEAVPINFFFDKNGEVFFYHPGYMSEQGIETILTALSAQ